MLSKELLRTQAMPNVIDFQERRDLITGLRDFDSEKDPCSECKVLAHLRRKNCTCEKASIWWNILAKKLKGTL